MRSDSISASGANQAPCDGRPAHAHTLLVDGIRRPTVDGTSHTANARISCRESRGVARFG
jgi:hypothetical protein